MFGVLMTVSCAVISVYFYYSLHNEKIGKNWRQDIFWICVYLVLDVSFFAFANAVFGISLNKVWDTPNIKILLYNLFLEVFSAAIFPVCIQELPRKLQKIYDRTIDVEKIETEICRKSLLDNKGIFYASVVILSMVCFVILYGVLPLKVTDDRWIAPGYMEYDVNQHYAGWLAVRNSKWGFPLGYTDTMNYPNGAIISFTDSIPLISILLKLFSAFLPETFQFFGIFVFACFILQGISAAMLLQLFVKDRRIVMISILLFLYCPIMVERAFRHCGLAAHFLVLFSLYLYFKSKKETHCLSKWYWLLGVFSIGIHPYFLPIVMGIYAADTVHVGIERKNIFKPAAHFLIGIVFTAFTGIMIGALGFSSGEGGGYGHAAMNLNGIFNPVSLSGIQWSAFLKALPYAKTWWPWDGFNYWGAGLLLFSGLFIAELLLKRLYSYQSYVRSLKNNIHWDKGFHFKYRELYVVLGCFGLFAVSNMVYFNDRLIYEYGLPAIPLLKRICEIFRASGRMFWPITYVVMVGIIWWLSTKRNRNVWIILLAGIQLLDLSPALITKHNEWKEENVAKKYEDTIFADETWSYLGKNIDYLWVMGNMGYQVTMYTQKHHIVTNAGYLNREITIHKEGRDYASELYSGKKIEWDTAYLFPKENSDGAAYASWVMNENLHVYDMENSYLIWQGIMKEKEQVVFERDGYQINLCNLTDDNWTNGMLNNSNGKIFLLPYSDCYDYLIKGLKGLWGSDGRYYGLKEVTKSEDEAYLLVEIDRSATTGITYFVCKDK